MHRIASLVLPSIALLAGASAYAQHDAAVARPAFSIDDRWTYRRIDAFTGLEKDRFLSAVEAIRGVQVELLDTDLGSTDGKGAGAKARRVFDGDNWSYANPQREGTFVAFDFPLTPGKSWEFDFTRPDRRGDNASFHHSAKVEGWETVTVPAGTFETLRVVHLERHMVHVADGVFPETLRDTYWYAPAAKRYVKRELRWRNFRTRLVIDDEEELVAYEVHPAASPTPDSGTYRSP